MVPENVQMLSRNLPFFNGLTDAFERLNESLSSVSRDISSTNMTAYTQGVPEDVRETLEITALQNTKKALDTFSQNVESLGARYSPRNVDVDGAVETLSKLIDALSQAIS